MYYPPPPPPPPPHTTKQQYMMSAEIQAKIVPNPALISCFKLASSSLNTLYYNDKPAGAGRINYLNYLK